MDKNGLGPILDENGNVKYETTKEDKIVIYADTLLGGIGRNHSLWHLVNASSIRGANSGRSHVAIDVPDGWTPAPGPATARPAVDRLRLHHVLVAANECVDQLEKVRVRIAQLATKKEISQGHKPVSPLLPDSVDLGELSFQMMSLAREAFVPAHRLCTAIIGLYMVEDFIRGSGLVEFPNSVHGRIRIPSKRSNRKTLLQLHMCVDSVTELYAKFQSKNPTKSRVPPPPPTETDEMRGIFLMMRHIIHELYSTGSGCFDLLNILIYIETPEQEAFTDFLNHLNSMEKSDLLEGISKLRRMVDHIPLLLEKLSWASYAVFRLTSGTTPDPSSIPSSGMTTPELADSSSKLTLDTSKHATHSRSKQGTSRPSRTMDKIQDPHSKTGVPRKRSEVRFELEEDVSDAEIKSGSSRSRERLTSTSKHNIHSGRAMKSTERKSQR